MTRREFLVGGLATSAALTSVGEVRGRHDPDLILLLSDCHVAAGGEDAFPYRRLRRCVDRALAMDPLPSRAFVFGDIAGTVGPKEDYEMSNRQFRRLEEAGIRVSYMMGNHDRRAGFLAVHPEAAALSPISGKLMQKISLPACDFLFLDSLIGPDGSDKIVVAGAIDAEQGEWLLRETAGETGKSVIVCAHHSPEELKLPDKTSLAEQLPRQPRVRGYIYGHVHRWAHTWHRRFDGDPRFMRGLSLPATGNWGDLGYALLRFDGTKAEVRLFQDDYCYPRPVAPEKRPASWDLVVADNRQVVCTFDLGTSVP